MFVGSIKARAGSPSISGRFPAILESACERIVGEGGGSRIGVIGCEETGFGEW